MEIKIDDKSQIRVFCTMDKTPSPDPQKGYWFTLSHYKNSKEFWQGVHDRFKEEQNDSRGYIFPIIARWEGPEGLQNLFDSNHIEEILFDIYREFSSDDSAFLIEYFGLYQRMPFLEVPPSPWTIDGLNELVNVHQKFTIDEWKFLMGVLMEFLDVYHYRDKCETILMPKNMGDLKDLRDRYIGRYDSKRSFFEEYLGQELPPISEPLRVYFDEEKYIDSFIIDKYQLKGKYFFRK